MKVKRSAVLLCVAIIFITGIVFCSGGFSEIKSSAKQNNRETDQNNALSIKLYSGFERQIKTNRFMEVRAEINNTGKNFTGSVQIVIPRNSRDGNIMYEKKFDLAAGETKSIKFYIPITVEGYPEIYCKVIDDKGRKLTEKTQNLRILYSGLMIGVLSDNISPLNYLSSESSYIYPLNGDDFPDTSKGLDTLDLIVINDFSTEQLNEEQYEALKQWVYDGGSLVIGTGESAGKVLGRFRDDFVNGTVGSTSAKETSFGISKEQLFQISNDDTFIRMAEYQKDGAERYRENTAYDITTEYAAGEQSEITAEYDEAVFKVEKELLDITLDNAVIVLNEGDQPILQKVEQGYGNILVFSMDLGLKPEQKEELGNVLLHVMYDNMSDEKKSQLVGEIENSYYRYNLVDSLRTTNYKSVPKVWKYAVVLFIYIMIAGPVLYLILKKRDKRNLTWIIVPILAVIFSGTIYVMGSETRISQPFTSFLNMVVVNGEGNVKENTYFSVMAPNNRKYSFELNGTKDIIPFTDGLGYSEKENKQYNIAIRTKGDSTQVEISGFRAFKTNYFSTSSQYKLDGAVDSELNRNSDSFTGNITNNLGVDLENAILFYDSKLIYLNKIDDGETISLDNKEQLLYSVEDLYNSSTFSLVFGDDNTEISNQIYLLQYIMNTSILREQEDGTLVAFSQENLNGDVLEEMKFDKNGMNVIVYPLKINNEYDGKAYIPDIIKYMTIEEGSIYSKQSSEMSSDTIEARYQFPTDAKMLQIAYRAENNSEFDPLKWYGFVGEMYFYNNRTSEYDIIFKSGIEGICNDLTDYIDKNNCLRIKYDANRSDMSIDTIKLPVLSAVKEAD